MAIGQFFNLSKKNIDNDIKVIIDKIAKVYNIGNKTNKTDKEDMIVFKVRYSKAIQALPKLCLYKE